MVEVVVAKRLVLIVSISRNELENLANSLVKEGYESLGATSLDEIDNALQQADKITLALIDITDFDESVWARCDQLRQARVPYIVITPSRAVNIPQMCVQYSASAAMVKPVDSRSLVAVIQALLV